MSSRLWLAAAFVIAFGASPARAETDLIAVTLDQAKIAKLPAGATTLVIGNPMIADVTMLKNNNSMVITGKGFGQTNLIAINGEGEFSPRSNSRRANQLGACAPERQFARVLFLQSDLHADSPARRRQRPLRQDGHTSDHAQSARRRDGLGKYVKYCEIALPLLVPPSRRLPPQRARSQARR